jgi:hypothetical protein
MHIYQIIPDRYELVFGIANFYYQAESYVKSEVCYGLFLNHLSNMNGYEAMAWTQYRLKNWAKAVNNA